MPSEDSTQSLLPVFDILLRIFKLFRFAGDLKSLSSCSRVCREFNTVASKVMYSEVILSPPPRNTLNLRDQDGLSVSSGLS